MAGAADNGGMSLSQELQEVFWRDLLRLQQQVKAFPEEALLWRPAGGMTNAAGNLVLHLEGNLREYIGRQLGGVAYHRNRPAEFATRDLPQQDLLDRVVALRELVPGILGARAEGDWALPYPEQVLGRPMTQRQFVIHLSGHLQYHLGQIDVQRRALTGQGALTLAGFA